MKTIKKIPIEYKKLDFIPNDKDLKQNTIYISHRFQVAVHLCLCGCKNKSVTPLNRTGWVIAERVNKITFTPSILNNNCPKKYHYVIRNSIANIL